MPSGRWLLYASCEACRKHSELSSPLNGISVKSVPQQCRSGLDAQHAEQQRAGPSADQNGGSRTLPISTLCHWRTRTTP